MAETVLLGYYNKISREPSYLDLPDGWEIVKTGPVLPGDKYANPCEEPLWLPVCYNLRQLKAEELSCIIIREVK